MSLRVVFFRTNGDNLIVRHMFEVPLQISVGGVHSWERLVEEILWRCIMKCQAG